MVSVRTSILEDLDPYPRTNRRLSTTPSTAKSRQTVECPRVGQARQRPGCTAGRQRVATRPRRPSLRSGSPGVVRSERSRTSGSVWSFTARLDALVPAWFALGRFGILIPPSLTTLRAVLLRYIQCDRCVAKVRTRVLLGTVNDGPVTVLLWCPRLVPTSRRRE